MEKMNKSQTIFVAHRGYSDIAPENTIPAFKEAIDNRFDGVECDIWEVKRPEEGTGDPDLMIMHDESLRRMCGEKKLIPQLTRVQLADYPVIHGNNIKRYGGTLPIPSYEEYLDMLKEGSTIPVVEIKSEKPMSEKNTLSKEATNKVLRLLAERGPGQSAVIQSFNRYSLHKVLEIQHQHYPEIKLTTLFLTSSSRDLQEDKLKRYKTEGISGICISDKIATATVIGLAKKQELKVGVWVVDDTTRARELTTALKIDYLISNKKLFI